MNLKIKNFLLIGLLLLLVAACGTGGSGGLTTNTTDSSGLSASHTADTGCIDRSSAVGIEGGGARSVHGVITSVGSGGTIVVGCVSVAAADAAVNVDGKAGTLSDLQVGQVVEVFGSTNPDTGEIIAERIDVDGADQPSSIVRVGAIRDSRFLPGFMWVGTFGLVTVDSDAGSGADIQLGDVVTLSGGEIASPMSVDQRGNATELLHVVDGIVDSVDLAHNRLKVLGQPVTFTFLDRFPRGSMLELTSDAESLAQSLARVRVGDRVAVSGHGSQSGEILATRIDPQGATHPLLVTGFVSALDTARLRFALSELTIDYSTAQLQEFPSGAPGAADHVAVFANVPPVDGILQATRVAYLSGKIAGPAGADVSMEGLITRVGSAVDFDIDGHPIRLKRDPVCGSEPSLLPQIDTWVGLYGGVLRPDGVVTDSDNGACIWQQCLGDISLSGPIEAISAQSFTVLGFEVNYSPVMTWWGDAGAGTGSMRLDASQLKIGDLVDVGGSPGLTGRELMASAIMRHTQDNDSETGYINTRLFELQSPDIIVAGRPIPTTERTTYESPVGRLDSIKFFFARSWIVRCGKTSQDYSILHIALSRAEGGDWQATSVEVHRMACPD